MPLKPGLAPHARLLWGYEFLDTPPIERQRLCPDLESGQACDHCVVGCGRVALSDILAGPQEATQLPPPRECLGHHVGSSSHAVRKPEPLRSHRQGGPSVSQPSAATQDKQPQTTPTPTPSDPGIGQVFPTESPDIMDRKRWPHVPTYRACQRNKVVVPTPGF